MRVNEIERERGGQGERNKERYCVCGSESKRELDTGVKEDKKR